MGPILQLLRRTRGRVPLHMPGHMGRGPLGTYLDTTELKSTDDLFAPVPGGAYETAQRAMAAALGYPCARFLTAGATQGVFAIILCARMAVLQRTGRPLRLLVARGAHKSVFHGCALCGVDPSYVYPKMRDGLCVYDEETLLSGVDAQPEKPDALLITAPDYYGVLPDTRRLHRALRDRGVLLLLDAAHGAHLPFLGMPVEGDLAVFSAHKTLPALTQCAVLAVGDPALAPWADRALLRVSSTSPSSLLALSLDEARAWTQRRGDRAYGRLLRQIDAFWRRCPFPNGQDLLAVDGLLRDPTRLVVDVSGRGLTGWAALDALSARGVDVEMADSRFLVAITTAMTRKSDLNAFLAGLRALPEGAGALPSAGALPPAGPRAMSLPQAMAAPVELVPLDQSAGRIAAACAGAYPPGIPFVAPGERVTPQAAQALARCAAPFGLSDGCLQVVREAQTKQ